MTQDTIERKSIGREAALGDLYDARKDSFCGCSLLSAKCAPLEVETIDNPAFTDTILFNNSFFNKLIKCDIDAELALSIACGMVPVSNFPNGDLVFKGRRNSTGSLIHTVSTKTDRIEITPKLMSFAVSNDELFKSNATHVVIGINWGSNSVLSITAHDEDVNGLKDYLEYISTRVSTNNVKRETTYHQISSTSSFQFDNDLDVQNGLLEQIDDVIEFISNVPKLIESKFNGQGRCLSFVLLPLSNLINNNKKQFDNINCCFQPVDTRLLCSLGDVVGDINEALVDVNDIKKLLGQNEFCVPAEIVKDVKMKKAMIDQAIESISESLINVRSGNVDSFSLEVKKKALQESPRIEQFIDGMQETINRIQFIQFAKSKGAYYIGKTSSFEETRRKILPSNEYHVLFYSSQSRDVNKDIFVLFTTFLKAKKAACFFADVDMNPELANGENVPEGSRICHFLNGQYIDLDVYKSFQEERAYNFARSVCNMKETISKPRKRVVIQLECPGSLETGECNNDAQQWVCITCKSTIEYGFDDNFYCECGKQSIESFEFRCTDMNHGENFIGFHPTTLKSKLDKVITGSEFNILVLGETGVGKSTWINAVANYLTYSTLEEAAEVKDLLCLVPTKFTLLDENCQETIVTIGSSKNEETRAGQACTQHPTAHLLTYGSDRIRIIDTPGIGDPRGIDQDKINVDNILKFVSNLDEIHGICLLLKPNNARLTVFFKFCVKEILAHLHKNSVDNLLFCFTNTRSTFYKPGDTYPALKELLSEINAKLKMKSMGKTSEIVLSSETMFCLDNEAFRFLCARRNGIAFEPEDLQNFYTY